jgi:hypothetical protein
MATSANSTSNSATESDDLFVYRATLDRPVIGIEAEFIVQVDGSDASVEDLWKHPSDFMRVPLLHRTTRSVQLPTGGAAYFDGGVIEVVTPLIEIAPRCTSRAVRSLWEQVQFISEQLQLWGRDHDKRVGLKAFSCHLNVSFEVPREERSADRTIQKLAILLARLLPVPVIFFGLNRRSTGVGVRPRRDRLEVTLDFTPDPSLMLVTTAVIVGIVRDVISWPSYRVELLEKVGLPILEDVEPGKHASRKGWVTRDYHFEKSPFASDVDEQIWNTTIGRLSIRQIATAVAWFFRRSIRWHSDPYTMRLMISMLSGRTRSLLELPDRPAGYADIGGEARWGRVLREFDNFSAELSEATPSWDLAGLDEHLAEREEARRRYLAGSDSRPYEEKKKDEEEENEEPLFSEAGQRLRRAEDVFARLSPPWTPTDAERRRWNESDRGRDRRRSDRRRVAPQPFSGDELDRSRYEEVFIRLGLRHHLRIGGELWEPAGMHGWYEAEFRRLSDGEERRISIEKLVEHPELWEE